MLSPTQLQDLAGGATILRRALEAAIVPPPFTPAGLAAFLRLTAAERDAQQHLTAASAHLAQASALLHRVADRADRADRAEQPVEMVDL